MTRSSPATGWLAVALAATVGACQASGPATAPPSDSASATGQPTDAATSTPTPRPTEKVEPPRESPSTDLPAGYHAAKTVPFGVGLVAGDVILGWNMDTATLYRWDAETFDDLGILELGLLGSFPPDVQSVSLGTGGVWVNMPSQHAAVLLDPATGGVTRSVTVGGWPYDMVEADGELWIADFEFGRVTRYDLETDTALATVSVGSPTDVIFSEGAAWAPVHVGRAAEHEPLSAIGYVARIDPATNKVDLIQTGPRPYYLASGFGAVWTGTATGASVERIDATTTEVTTIWVGEDGAFDIEVVGDSVWAVTGPQWPRERLCDPETSFFVRIDPTTSTVRERVAFPCPGSITPAGDGFWVSGQNADGPLSVLFEPDE